MPAVMMPVAAIVAASANNVAAPQQVHSANAVLTCTLITPTTCRYSSSVFSIENLSFAKYARKQLGEQAEIVGISYSDHSGRVIMYVTVPTDENRGAYEQQKKGNTNDQ